MSSGPSVPILMYHRIGPRVANSIVKDQYVPAALFERQLRTLKDRGFRTISLDEMKATFEGRGEPKTERAVVLTFDDGYGSFYTAALPLLKKYGMTALVFLVADCVGRTNRWDEAKGDVTEALMSFEEIRASMDSGMEFGAHTKTHPDLRFCDDNLARKEIALSKEELQNGLDRKILWFSYPYGKYGERERILVREAGYLGACGTKKHANTLETDIFALGRINVRATTSPRYLLYKLKKASDRNA